MNATEIKSVLKPLGILNGINIYPDEPTPSCHCVSVALGHGREAIDAINAAGGDARFVPGVLGVYSDSIFVERSLK